MSEHVCRLSDPWPTGHPEPVEDPARLTGPEVGEFVIYHDKYAELQGEPAEVVVRVLRRSYVWSPGECRSKGGYRHYDWTVIERGPDRYRVVVVNEHRPVTISPPSSPSASPRQERGVARWTWSGWRGRCARQAFGRSPTTRPSRRPPIN